MKIRIDLRDIPAPHLTSICGRFSEDVGLLLNAWQWVAWHSLEKMPVSDSRRVMLVVPDFLYYARLAGTRQTKAILGLPNSTSRLFKSALACIPTGAKNIKGLAGGEFWAAAEALLAYDIGLVEKHFQGTLILHHNLADFAWLFGEGNFIRNFIGTTRSRGVSTQMVPHALSASARWEAFPSHFIFTPGFQRQEVDLLILARQRAFFQTQYILDLTQWPADLFGPKSKHPFQREVDDEWLLSVESAVLYSANEPLTP